MMHVPVNIMWDISIGFAMHGQVGPVGPLAGPEAATPGPAVEIPIPHAWPVGVAMQSVKHTTTVTHSGTNIILDGHDCGLLIPQLTIPPANLWMPLLPITSKRKTMFAASTVKMNGLPTAVASPVFFPMMSCAVPVALPLTVPVTSIIHSAQVGVTLADIVGGVLNIAASMAIDYAMSKMFPMNQQKALAWSQNFASQYLKGLVGKGASSYIKAGLSAAAGFGISAVQHAIDGRNPLKVNLSLGLFDGTVKPTLSAQFGSSDPSSYPSKVTGSVEGHLPLPGSVGPNGVPGSLNGTATSSYTWDAGSNRGNEGLSGQVNGRAQVPGRVDAAGHAEASTGDHAPSAPLGQPQDNYVHTGSAQNPGVSVPFGVPL